MLIYIRLYAYGYRIYGFELTNNLLRANQYGSWATSSAWGRLASTLHAQCDRAAEFVRRRPCESVPYRELLPDDCPMAPRLRQRCRRRLPAHLQQPVQRRRNRWNRHRCGLHGLNTALAGGTPTNPLLRRRRRRRRTREQPSRCRARSRRSTTIAAVRGSPT